MADSTPDTYTQQLLDLAIPRLFIKMKAMRQMTPADVTKYLKVNIFDPSIREYIEVIADYDNSATKWCFNTELEDLNIFAPNTDIMGRIRELVAKRAALKERPITSTSGDGPGPATQKFFSELPINAKQNVNIVPDYHNPVRLTTGRPGWEVSIPSDEVPNQAFSHSAVKNSAASDTSSSVFAKILSGEQQNPAKQNTSSFFPSTGYNCEQKPSILSGTTAESKQATVDLKASFAFGSNLFGQPFFGATEPKKELSFPPVQSARTSNPFNRLLAQPRQPQVASKALIASNVFSKPVPIPDTNKTKVPAFGSLAAFRANTKPSIVAGAKAQAPKASHSFQLGESLDHTSTPFSSAVAVYGPLQKLEDLIIPHLLERFNNAGAMTKDEFDRVLHILLDSKLSLINGNAIFLGRSMTYLGTDGMVRLREPYRSIALEHESDEDVMNHVRRVSNVQTTNAFLDEKECACEEMWCNCWHEVSTGRECGGESAGHREAGHGTVCDVKTGGSANVPEIAAKDVVDGVVDDAARYGLAIHFEHPLVALWVVLELLKLWLGAVIGMWNYVNEDEEENK